MGGTKINDRQLKQAAFDSIMRDNSTIRQVWAVYKRPCPDVLGSVVIGVGTVAARTAAKMFLAEAILLVGISALGALPAGVAGVYCDYWQPGQPGLVFQEGAQLKERPGMQNRALLAPNRDALAEAGQILDGQAAIGVFSGGNDLLADIVVDPGSEAVFTAREFLESPLGGAGLLLLEFGPQTAVTMTHRFDGRTGVAFSVAISGDIDDPQIDAKEVIDLNRRTIGNLNCGIQEEIPIAVDEIHLALDPIEAPFLVFAVDQRDDHAPAGQRPQAHLVEALETEDAFVVGYGPVGFEDRTNLLAALEGFHSFPNTSHRHLRGQTEAGANLEVTPAVDAGLGEDARAETGFGGEAGRVIEPLHGFQQQWMLLGAGQEFELQRQLHTSIVGAFRSNIKRKKEGAIPPPPEGGGLLAQGL